MQRFAQQHGSWLTIPYQIRIMLIIKNFTLLTVIWLRWYILLQAFYFITVCITTFTNGEWSRKVINSEEKGDIATLIYYSNVNIPRVFAILLTACMYTYKSNFVTGAIFEFSILTYLPLHYKESKRSLIFNRLTEVAFVLAVLSGLLK